MYRRRPGGAGAVGASIRPGGAGFVPARRQRIRRLPHHQGAGGHAGDFSHRPGGRGQRGSWVWIWGRTIILPSPSGCGSWFPAFGACCAGTAAAAGLYTYGSVQINTAQGKVYPRRAGCVSHRAGIPAAHGPGATTRGSILSRNQLLESIWDVSGDFVNDNTLTVYIKRLREKIEEDPQNPSDYPYRPRPGLPHRREGIAVCGGRQKLF